MNILEPALSFAEGLALILSPCILPVLPIILSTTVDGGRARPFGIVSGFVMAFSAFALLSRKIVTVLHIDLNLIKDASLFLLLMLGIVMMSSTLSNKFSTLTQRFANIGSKLSGRGGDGFASGIGIGALIGLVWTPCAGPILAAVLVQVIRQENDLSSLFIITAFALGAAIPMLTIAFLGKSIIGKIRGATRHTEYIRKVFGALMIAGVLVMASGVDLISLFGKPPETTMANIQSKALINPLDEPYTAPAISDIQQWFNSEPLTTDALKGKVVLIDFWTYSCINCIRTLPYITSWDQKYRDRGLVIIGVHAPEFEFEKDPKNVQDAINARNIQYPVALDNNFSTWSNFKNRFWPAHYLIDRDGRVVYTHFGEGNYDVTENNIRFLLGLEGEKDNTPAPATEKQPLTPETYLGMGRAENYVGTPLLGENTTYTAPDTLSADAWALKGGWDVMTDKIVSTSDNAVIKINVRAAKVYLVLGRTGNVPVAISLSFNGQALSDVTVDQHTLYQLLDLPQVSSGILEIKVPKPGVEAYAFTFGR